MIATRSLIANPHQQQIPPLRCAPVGMTHLLNQSFTCIYLSIRLACGWSRRCGTAEGVDGDGEEAEADEAEGAGLGEALFTGLGSGARGRERRRGLQLHREGCR